MFCVYARQMREALKIIFSEKKIILILMCWKRLVKHIIHPIDFKNVYDSG